MFRASGPVTSIGFVDREAELAQLTRAFGALLDGAPRWVAILGRRKVGKTSLLLEAARRMRARLDVVVLDVFEMTPLTPDLFRQLVLRTLDALLSSEVGGSFEHAADDPEMLGRLLDRAPSLEHLPSAKKSELRERIGERAHAESVRHLLQLPEDLARMLDRRIVVAIDEAQELAGLAAGRQGFDPFPIMRAVWQHHGYVSYVISGSAPTMLEALVTSRHSPFFQHFETMALRPFAKPDAVRLLTEQSPVGRAIPVVLAEKMADVLGGHPFYLQLAGEALVAQEPPYDESALKQALQSLVFSSTGRLALYFQNEYDRLIGNATTLAATLEALAHGPLRLTDVASAIGASTASTARYLERLGDVVERLEDGTYAIGDPVFALWLRWRAPGGTVVPMSILGDDAERAVAGTVAALGFELVYQSRASRGAFDLLALRGATQLGLQVKRSALPLRFKKSEWSRMDADAARWDWRWVVAQVDPETQVVRVLDPGRAHVGREVRLDASAEIENLLLWLDGGSRRQRRSKPRTSRPTKPRAGRSKGPK